MHDYIPRGRAYVLRGGSAPAAFGPLSGLIPSEERPALTPAALANARAAATTSCMAVLRVGTGAQDTVAAALELLRADAGLSITLLDVVAEREALARPVTVASELDPSLEGRLDVHRLHADPERSSPQGIDHEPVVLVDLGAWPRLPLPVPEGAVLLDARAGLEHNHLWPVLGRDQLNPLVVRVGQHGDWLSRWDEVTRFVGLAADAGHGPRRRLVWLLDAAASVPDATWSELARTGHALFFAA